MVSLRKSLSSLLALALAAVMIVGGAQIVAASVSVTDAPDPAPISVDNSTIVRELEVVSAGTITDVSITVDFHKTDGTCAVPATGLAHPREIGLALTSPSGTSVQLVRQAPTGQNPTYDANGASARVQVTFTDDAENQVGSTHGGMPATGEFRPQEPLAAFVGDQAMGTWQLTVIDRVGADPLCYFGATLMIDSYLEAPVLEGGPLLEARVGHSYSTELPLASGSHPADSFTIVDGDLPAGLTLDEETGVVSGVPTAAGDVTFSATGTNTAGTSDQVEFTLRVVAAPSLTGDAEVTARIAVEFTYAPTLDEGFPAASVALTAGVLPEGLNFDASTGEISGTPSGALGEYPVTLTADNGVGDPAVLELLITLDAGPVDGLTLSAPQTTVDEGDSLTFTVTAADAEGNVVELVEGEVILSSSVETDVIDGLTVTFPSASPHTITATHVDTGMSDALTIEVIAAEVDVEVGEDDVAETEDELSDSGPRSEYAALTAIALALAMLGAGLLVAARRRLAV